MEFFKIIFKIWRLFIMTFKTLRNFAEARKKFKQSFDRFVDDYVYNEVTDKVDLLETKKDLQAIIDSNADCALTTVLEKFLDTGASFDMNDEYQRKVVDLSVIGAALERAEDYREDYELPDEMSYADIYKFVEQQALDLKSKIENKQKGVKEDEKKENIQEKE